MFEYNGEDEDFDNIVGAIVRRDDMVIIGRVDSVDKAVDGYGHENAVAIIHKYSDFETPMFRTEIQSGGIEVEVPVTFKMNCRNLISDETMEVDTKAVTVWFDDNIGTWVGPGEFSFKEEKKEFIKFGPPVNDNRFAYKVVGPKPRKNAKKNVETKSANFFEGVANVKTLSIGGK